jgi:hypothetical protein
MITPQRLTKAMLLLRFISVMGLIISLICFGATGTFTYFTSAGFFAVAFGFSSKAALRLLLKEVP